MENEKKLNNNSLSFIALANEFCALMESARESEERDEFVVSLLKLLPRLYIVATDLTIENEPETYLESYLDEDYYESIRRNLEILMGPDDVYLEVFEEDMKYSDTPISASISESLADIYQDLYNFIYNVKDAPHESISDYVSICKENFETYWGQILCNVMRALHNLKYNHENL